MRNVYYLIQFLLVILAVLFLAQNQGQTVEIRFLGFGRMPTVDLLFVIITSFVLGAVLMWVYLTIGYVQNRTETRKLKARNTQMQSELESLRNMSVESIPEELPEDHGAPALPAETTTRQSS